MDAVYLGCGLLLWLSVQGLAQGCARLARRAKGRA
jgi:hypothetical protein